MPISLPIPEPTKQVKRSFTLSDRHWQMFDEYLTAAKGSTPEVTEDVLIGAILEQQIKKDREFQNWKKTQTKNKET